MTRTKNKFKIEISADMAEFLGWYSGDGCISINNRYSEFALTGDITEEMDFYQRTILTTFNNIFQRSEKIKNYTSNGVCGLYVFDKKFVSWLIGDLGLQPGKKINLTVPDSIPKNLLPHFLRGLFDTDGSIYYCRSNYKPKKESAYNLFHYKPKIKLATISKKLITQVYNILIELGYHPRLRKPTRQRTKENIMYGVVLHRNEDTRKYI